MTRTLSMLLCCALVGCGGGVDSDFMTLRTELTMRLTVDAIIKEMAK